MIPIALPGDRQSLSPFHSLDHLVSSTDTMLERLLPWFRRPQQQSSQRYRPQLQELGFGPIPRQDLAWEIARCLEQDEFELNYQPQICLRDGSLLGVEVLIRWFHPHLGLISPAEFIPIAEQTGLIVPLGYWILKKSCQQYQGWMNQGIRPFKLSVNLSLRQLSEDDLLERVEVILEQTRMNPACLALEVTESLVLQNPGEAIQRLHQLQKLGIQIAVDDFGVGYSSLSYLRDLPLQIIKIDKSFLDNLLTMEKNQVILQSIIELGHRLSLKIIAEGIEDKDQLELLKAMECDYGQGYFFSRPLGLKGITHYFREFAPFTSLSFTA